MLKIFSSVKKGLSLSINFKELVGWKKKTFCTGKRRWNRLLVRKGQPSWLWASQLPFQRLPEEVTANTPLHMFVEWRPPRLAQKRPPQQRFTSPFHTLNQCFSWLEKTTVQLFFIIIIFLPLPSFNSETFFSVDFMNSCPTPGANWKNPTGQFQHREDYCSSNTTPLSGQEFRS